MLEEEARRYRALFPLMKLWTLGLTMTEIREFQEQLKAVSFFFLTVPDLLWFWTSLPSFFPPPLPPSPLPSPLLHFSLLLFSSPLPSPNLPLADSQATTHGNKVSKLVLDVGADFGSGGPEFLSAHHFMGAHEANGGGILFLFVKFS
jgi:hypothetical protein